MVRKQKRLLKLYLYALASNIPLSIAFSIILAYLLAFFVILVTGIVLL